MSLKRDVHQEHFVDCAVERAKAEILRDIDQGLVPSSVGSFSDLHDHVDANCYAGCCEESTAENLRGLDLWNSIFRPTSDDDGEALGSEATLDAINEMHERVDLWLISGAHRVHEGLNCEG